MYTIRYIDQDGVSRKWEAGNASFFVIQNIIQSLKDNGCTDVEAVLHQSRDN